MQSLLKSFKQIVKKLLKLWYEERINDLIDVRISSPRLKRFLEIANIKVLDVGARGGPLNPFQLFAQFAELFICEPDIGEIKKVEQELQREGRWKNVTALPFALGSKVGTAILHLGEKGGLSSLLEANAPEMKKFYSISGWSRVVKNVSVPIETLDHAAERFGFKDLAVIKLDTQGTELDILKSGEKNVMPNVLAVYVEMEFIPLYKDQPLFGEVNAFLEKQGFRLIDLKRTALRRKTNAKPVYSKRKLSWAHGLYFRTRHADGSELLPDEKIKLACIAYAFEYFDYTLWLLEQPDAQMRLQELGLSGVENDILDFSREFWSVLKRRLNWLRKREVLGTVYTDRKHER